MKTLAERRAEREEQLERNIESCAGMLLQACMDAQMRMSGDYRVSEIDAAILLGIAPGSLKNLRQNGWAPVHHHRGVNGSRVSYRIQELATWIENGRYEY